MKVAGKYISVAMAMLMLVMSIGITAHKMVCLGSGAVTLSFFEKQDCCGTESSSSTSVEKKCCQFSTDYFKLDIQTLVSNFDFKFDLSADHFTMPVCFLPEITTNQYFEAAHSPPLLSGKDILILASVFRI